jgi:hypothetical protein
VRDKRIADVTPVPIDINFRFQAVLAPTAARPPKPMLAEQRPAALPAQ